MVGGSVAAGVLVHGATVAVAVVAAAVGCCRLCGRCGGNGFACSGPCGLEWVGLGRLCARVTEVVVRRLVLPFSSTAMLVRRRLGGGAGGLAGACWWRRGGASGCAGLLPVEAMRRQRGVGYWLDQERVAGMVLSRAKAFTDDFVGGDGGGALVVSFSLLGAPL